MREIKFRGRDGDDWYYGSLFVDSAGQTAICAPKSFWMKPVKAETVGQFTGKKDINDKKLYEGDIIKFYDDRAHERIGVIKWHEKMYCWIIDCGEAGRVMLADYACEIRGNIHDNPELLEAHV